MPSEVERYQGQMRHQQALRQQLQRRGEPPVCITTQVESGSHEVVRYVDRTVEIPARRTRTFFVEVPEGCGCLEFANQRLAAERNSAVVAALGAELPGSGCKGYRDTEARERQSDVAWAKAATRSAAMWERTRADILRFGCHGFTPECPSPANDGQGWSR